jgi:hypothetical protein
LAIPRVSDESGLSSEESDPDPVGSGSDRNGNLSRKWIDVYALVRDMAVEQEESTNSSKLAIHEPEAGVEENID